jgi:hypothetical protein
VAGKASSVVEMGGLKLGKLTVLAREPRKDRRVWWRCRRECGREVVCRGDQLRSFRIKSCGSKGCIVFPPRERRSVEIDLTARCWHAMRQRCENPNADNFAWYGGRGITICARWAEFENFVADMGVRPSIDHTIDRVDVNGNYDPGNCVWATKDEQRRNQRRTIYLDEAGARIKLIDVIDRLGETIVTYEGRRMSVIEVCGANGIPRNVIYTRIKLGWSLADALSVPVRPKKPNRAKAA